MHSEHMNIPCSIVPVVWKYLVPCCSRVWQYVNTSKCYTHRCIQLLIANTQHFKIFHCLFWHYSKLVISFLDWEQWALKVFNKKKKLKAWEMVRWNYVRFSALTPFYVPWFSFQLVRGTPFFEPIQISMLAAETADKMCLFINISWIFWCYLFRRSWILILKLKSIIIIKKIHLR